MQEKSSLQMFKFWKCVKLCYSKLICSTVDVDCIKIVQDYVILDIWFMLHASYFEHLFNIIARFNFFRCHRPVPDCSDAAFYIIAIREIAKKSLDP